MTTLKLPRQVEGFYRNLERGVRLKAKKMQKSQKRWITSLESRYVHDYLTEIVLFKQNSHLLSSQVDIFHFKDESRDITL